MGNTRITKEGWVRTFEFYGREEKEVETEVSAYEEGLEDGAPGQFETERDYNDTWITVTVRRKTP